jgi:hypothetical protein
MNNVTFLWQFDEARDSFQWIFLHNCYDSDWARLLEARKRKQVKQMRDIIRQLLCNLPKPSENPIGWEALELLAEE